MDKLQPFQIRTYWSVNLSLRYWWFKTLNSKSLIDVGASFLHTTSMLSSIFWILYFLSSGVKQ